MDIQLNIWELLGAAAIAWAAIRVELAIRRRGKKTGSSIKETRKLPPALIGIINKGAKAIECKCGHTSENFLIYEGQLAVCFDCAIAGAEPCSCGHVDTDGKIYPNGTRFCSECAPLHDSEEDRKLRAEKTYHAVQRELYDASIARRRKGVA